MFRPKAALIYEMRPSFQDMGLRVGKRTPAFRPASAHSARNTKLRRVDMAKDAELQRLPAERMASDSAMRVTDALGFRVLLGVFCNASCSLGELCPLQRQDGILRSKV